MILGIDASNIRVGGGVTHLAELLRAAEPERFGFSVVIVWASTKTLRQLDDRPWLVKRHSAALDAGLTRRALWQRFRLSVEARAAGCSMLFIPGGSYAGSVRPMVVMSQNLLPFEWRELKRFGWTRRAFKLMLVRFIQSRTFRTADGVIFLTQYGREAVLRVVPNIAGQMRVIPHGIDGRFARPPRAQLSIDHYSLERPFRLLYVSPIDVYKHQWHVAEAVALLRRQGLPVHLQFVGPGIEPAITRLRNTVHTVDPHGEFITLSGRIPHAHLPEQYVSADACVFASSCETFGQILTEAMSSGLPIACSNCSAMPELLGDAGVYFDPENPADIARAIAELINSPAKRAEKAKTAFDCSQAYSWKRCAAETFELLATVATNVRGSA